MSAIDQSAEAKQHRAQLEHVTFIAITGSCGKTTTNNLAAALLRPDLHGPNSADDANCGPKLVENLLSVNAGDDFCIQELGAWGPGTLDAGIGLVQPDIGVVLNVRNDHYGNFKGREHTQAEKSKVVSVLPPGGTAILNVDDPYVWQMRELTSARVLGFGTGEDAELRAANIRANWPDTLSFDLSYRGQSFSVQTQLLGEHLVGSALAAMAIALEMGVSLRTAIARLAEAQPTPRRMSVVALEPGLTFIRDDFKSTYDSRPEVVRFLQRAQARRKVVVLGRISDHPGRSRGAYTKFAREVADTVDLLVLVSKRAEDLWGRHRRGEPDFLADFADQRAQVRLFETVHEAAQYVRDSLQPGDLVFLKASGVSDHLERILLQFQTPVRCWRTQCGLSLACDDCELLGQVGYDDGS